MDSFVYGVEELLGYHLSIKSALINDAKVGKSGRVSGRVTKMSTYLGCQKILEKACWVDSGLFLYVEFHPLSIAPTVISLR